MKIIPGKSTHIRRKVQSFTYPELKIGDIFKVVGWFDGGSPKIVNPKTGEEHPCSLEFWEDASFEENLKNILKE